MPGAQDRANLYRLGSAALWLFALYLYFWHPHASKLIDFSTFWAAAEKFSIGENIYSTPFDVQAHNGAHFKLYYIYPPFLAGLLSIFTFLPKLTAQTAWCFMSYLAVLGSTIVITQIVREFLPTQRGKLFFAVTFLMICFEPVYWGIRLGQIDVLILLALSIALLKILRGDSAIAGAALGIAIILKMSPAIFLLAIFRPSMKKTWAGLIATVASATILLHLLGFPLTEYRDFLAALHRLSSGETNAMFVTDFSIYRPLLSLIGLDFLGAAGWVLKVCLLACAAYLTFRLSFDTPLQRFRVWAILTCFMIVLAPTVHFQHLTWTLLPLGCLAVLLFLRSTTHDEQQRFRHALIVLAFYFAIDQANLIMYQTLKLAPAAITVAQLFPALIIAVFIFFLSTRSTENNLHSNF